MITAFQAKYIAYDLTRRYAPDGIGRLSQSLFDASVDLNPHQIEAALFALKSPLSKGVFLADEVVLGKTIEAGIVLCQYWSERERRLLVICPASLRKQWAMELQEKFNLPAIVLDAKTWRDWLKKDQSPLNQKAVIVLSYNYASKICDELKAIAWDLVVIDEAHKLHNAYRESNKIGQSIRWATEDCRKLLLTATPLQNSLLELYGLSTLIDEHLFGDVNAFRTQYVGAGGDLDSLRQRLSGFCRRTLRNQVTEYIRYTERRAITQPFRRTDNEHQLYESVSDFLLRPNSYASPQRQRHLTELILRKLLASSSLAIAGTLETMKQRLETLRDEEIQQNHWFAEQLITEEDIEGDLLDEILEIDPPEEDNHSIQTTVDRKQLEEEIAVLSKLTAWARNIGTDTKTHSLLTALEIGFQQRALTGARRKALIFTESRRTQMYQRSYGNYGVETVTASFRRLLTDPAGIGEFDFVYSTGLFDYLNQRKARRLVLGMFQMLRPGSKLLVANFLPGVRDIGYMETFMDWQLIYRSRRDMVDLTMDIPEEEVEEVRIVSKDCRNLVFLELRKT